MTSKIKQVGRGAGIDKLTTQIHHFLQQFFFFFLKIILGKPSVPFAGRGRRELEGRVGRECQEGAGKRQEDWVRETLYLISFDTQF